MLLCLSTCIEMFLKYAFTQNKAIPSVLSGKSNFKNAKITGSVHNQRMKQNIITEYFEEVEATKEYDGYFCSGAPVAKRIKTKWNGRWKRCTGFWMFTLQKMIVG